ncbi:hypothetical protein [Massiliimalia timonensis]|uniref:hypothetical protein n=1 Tax=Massiliimalia timonensis TaxID=1987501 RepID=UPI0018A01FA5|nr:hypothetical protein [Massiliimalia timonensis]
MALYKICPHCGAYLDHGEQCDCDPCEERQGKPLEYPAGNKRKREEKEHDYIRKEITYGGVRADRSTGQGDQGIPF